MLKCLDSFPTDYFLVFSSESDETTISMEPTDDDLLEQTVSLLENEMYSFSVEATNEFGTSTTSYVEIGTFPLHSYRLPLMKVKLFYYLLSLFLSKLSPPPPVFPLPLAHIVTSDVQGATFCLVGDSSYSIQCNFIAGSDASGCGYVLVGIGVENITGVIFQTNTEHVQLEKLSDYSILEVFDVSEESSNHSDELVLFFSLNSAPKCPFTGRFTGGFKDACVQGAYQKHLGVGTFMLHKGSISWQQISIQTILSNEIFMIELKYYLESGMKLSTRMR